MKTNPNEPIYQSNVNLLDPSTGLVTDTRLYVGLTKREWFAGLALQGMIAGSQGLNITVKQFAEQSVKLAEALIAELNKESE